MVLSGRVSTSTRSIYYDTYSYRRIRTGFDRGHVICTDCLACSSRNGWCYNHHNNYCCRWYSCGYNRWWPGRSGRRHHRGHSRSHWCWRGSRCCSCIRRQLLHHNNRLRQLSCWISGCADLVLRIWVSLRADLHLKSVKNPLPVLAWGFLRFWGGGRETV